MNSEKQELNVKRVSTRKRSRDVPRTHLTPARKRGGGPQLCPPDRRVSSNMADVKAVEVIYTIFNESTLLQVKDDLILFCLMLSHLSSFFERYLKYTMTSTPLSLIQVDRAQI